MEPWLGELPRPLEPPRLVEPPRFAEASSLAPRQVMAHRLETHPAQACDPGSCNTVSAAREHDRKPGLRRVATRNLLGTSLEQGVRNGNYRGGGDSVQVECGLKLSDMQSQPPPVGPTTEERKPFFEDRDLLLLEYWDASSRVKYKCPTCGLFLSTREEAAHHTAHCGPQDIIRYRCSVCSEVFGSREQALAHCAGEEAASTKSSEEPTVVATAASVSATATLTAGAVDSGPALPATTPAASTAAARAVITAAAGCGISLPVGEPVAYDSLGRPIIVRQVDMETGRMRTVVRNEDGSLRAFGETTMMSLVSSADDDARHWVGELTDRELRGLVHEVGQRLLGSSREYERHKASFEVLADRANYAFFGLPAGASEKDLDNAYRQLAKKMHPDKNGGTEEAKKRFQCMKERYEALKKRRGSGIGGCDSDADAGSGEDGAEELNGDGSGGDMEERGPEVCDEDNTSHVEGEKRSEEESNIAYDPTDRESLHASVWKMLDQLKPLQRALKEITESLKRAG